MIVCVVIGIGDTPSALPVKCMDGLMNFNKAKSTVPAVYYSSSVSVVIVFNYVFIEIALAVLVILWLKIDFRGRFLC